MDLQELTDKLRELKTRGKFVDITVEAVWQEFVEPALAVLEWNDLEPKGINTLEPQVQLASGLYIFLANGRAPAQQVLHRADMMMRIGWDTNLVAITNFDEWEILFKGETIAEFRSEELAISSSARRKWRALLSQSSYEERTHLHEANALRQQRIDEEEVEHYVSEFNRLREIVGSALIANPEEITPIKRGQGSRKAYDIIGLSGDPANRERDEMLLNHVVQRLIDRFLIFRFAEDANILVEGNPKPLSSLYYKHLLETSEEQLRNQDTVWRHIAGRQGRGNEGARAGLFGKFAKTYNGGVFEPVGGRHPDRVNALPLNDWIVRRIIKSVVHRPVKKKLARLLGYIYEKYIGQRLYIVAAEEDASRLAEKAGYTKAQQRKLKERLEDEGPFVELANTPEKKEQAIYYTPEDVTKYITDNTVGQIISELDNQLHEVDYISGEEAEETLLSIFRSAHSLSVLDPACGSGAFLIQALGLLRDFYRRLARTIAEQLNLKEYGFKKDGEILQRARNTGSEALGEALIQLKTPGVLALNWNLYGVDLDPRAVEICSVSLMIQVIEELNRQATGEVVRFPSIMGENIKHGNAVLSNLEAEGWREHFEGCEDAVEELVSLRNELKTTREEKRRKELWSLIRERRQELAERVPERIDNDYAPFDWPIEFPEVFWGPNQGFSVVMGNPPYTDIEIQFPPEIAEHRYETTNSKDLYTLMMENIIHLTTPDSGYGGMIVPLSLTFSRFMRTLREEIAASHRVWRISSYDRIPDAIFGHNVRTRNSIAIMQPSAEGGTKIMTSPMMRWFAEEREHLFDKLHHHDCTDLVLPIGFPRLGSDVQSQGLKEMFDQGHSMREVITSGGKWKGGDLSLYFSRTAYNWLAFSTDIPPITDKDGNHAKSDSIVYIEFCNEEALWASLAILNGQLMYWFWLMYDDGFHVGKKTIKYFPVSPNIFDGDRMREVIELGKRIDRNMKRNIVYKKNAGKRIGKYNILECRDLTDKVDDLIADELGLGRDFLSDVQDFCDSTIRTSYREEVAA